MSEDPNYQQDLASIRAMMERSVKFISLSGLSGILAGIYALAGAAYSYFILYYPTPLGEYRLQSGYDGVLELFVVAVLVLVASLVTGFWMSMRKAAAKGVSFWDSTSQRLVINLLIPLATGGALILILIYYGYFGLVAPASLIFYGLALVNASPNLYEEIRYLGYFEIIAGLACAALPGFGLLFWSIGFGVFHIFYGALMFRKYD